MSEPSGGFWVVEYNAPSDDTPRWSVFDGEGRFLGVVTLPDRFDLYDVGDDYVLGRWLDADDVEHVQVWELLKPERDRPMNVSAIPLAKVLGEVVNGESQ